MLEKLKEEVFAANARLVSSGLVVLTWGNASGYDPETKLVVIKPSGVDYATMKPSDMVVVDLDGTVVEGKLRPSSDTPTHVALYRAFPGVGGIVHTHSVEATAWAQAGREIPAYGTTHADTFHGPVPLTRVLTEPEVAEAYEANTGKVIVERFRGLEPLAVPGVLVRGHAPFAWGKNAADAVDHAVALEAIARMARLTEQVHAASPAAALASYVGEKHYQRKHGKNAYYGQSK
jgi:L-ribulose-5-phosphate 4-epimerase